MELKLQQAIVATKAGRTDIAQTLLTQLIHDNPDNANAWFLLGHLVDKPDRQSRFLHKTVALDPNNVIAKKQLLKLENQLVPAPVLPEDSTPVADDSNKIGDTRIASPPSEASSEGTGELETERVENTVVADDDWQETASVPVREVKSIANQAPTTTVPQQKAPIQEPLHKQTSGDVWLVRILLIMVIIAAIVLGILVLLLLI